MQRKQIKNIEDAKRSLIAQNLIFTVATAFWIPLVEGLPFLDDQSTIILEVIGAILIVYLVIRFSVKEADEKRELQENLNEYEKYRTANKIINYKSEVDKIKGNILKANKLSNHVEEVLLYNPHECLELTCQCIKRLISDMTEINQEMLSVSFIYTYPEYHDAKWKWITRKDTTINQELDRFVRDEKFHSYFNYLVSSSIVADFQHEKSELIQKGKYWISENDRRHTQFGSIAGYKISFSREDEEKCIGYLIVSSYGRTFIENAEDSEKIKEFEEFMSNMLIPSFRYHIEAELGFMYERHRIKREKSDIHHKDTNLQSKINCIKNIVNKEK